MIVGATKAEQLKENCKAVETTIPESVLAELDKGTSKLKYAMGSNPDLW